LCETDEFLIAARQRYADRLFLEREVLQELREIGVQVGVRSDLQERVSHKTVH
jgi:hypothetical protein